MSRAGNWEIKVSEPYPAWAEVCFEGKSLVRVHHRDLRDLEYAVKRAILEARDKMPETHRHELD